MHSCRQPNECVITAEGITDTGLELQCVHACNYFRAWHAFHQFLGLQQDPPCRLAADSVAASWLLGRVWKGALAGMLTTLHHQ